MSADEREGETPTEPVLDDNDIVLRFSPFGLGKEQAVVEKALIHERELGDGVLAISVFVMQAPATPTQVAQFIHSVPVGGRWIWTGSPARLRDAGFDLRWDPIQATDRHYLVPFGVTQTGNEELLDSVTRLVGSFDERSKSPAELRGG